MVLGVRLWLQSGKEGVQQRSQKRLYVLFTPLVGPWALQLDGQEPLNADTGIRPNHKRINTEIADEQRDQGLRGVRLNLWGFSYLPVFFGPLATECVDKSQARCFQQKLFVDVGLEFR